MATQTQATIQIPLDIPNVKVGLRDFVWLTFRMMPSGVLVRGATLLRLVQRLSPLEQ